MTDFLKTSLSRRNVLQAAAVGAAGVSPALRSVVYAAGSDAPEKKEVKIGFIPLTDCASVVMASVLGLDQKYGVKIIPTKEASWAGVRDKLVNGELDMAHVLWGLIYGVHMGTSGPKKDMAILMNLNHNGQAVTLSKKLNEKGVSQELVEEAISGITAEDDFESAKQLATRRYRQMAHLERDVRTRRLAGYLQRKGYGSSSVFAAIKFAEDVYLQEAAGDQ